MVKKAADAGVKDVKNYILHLIEEVVRDKRTEDYSAEEEEKIKKRLKDLGYIE